MSKYRWLDDPPRATWTDSEIYRWLRHRDAQQPVMLAYLDAVHPQKCQLARVDMESGRVEREPASLVLGGWNGV